ncbi:MAG: hypothetical protein EOO75_16450 [Myxococcales bacterium]|nr:MAG: hypothetical protein EOO75_16450 [Myxococcales bacterium]
MRPAAGLALLALGVGCQPVHPEVPYSPNPYALRCSATSDPPPPPLAPPGPVVTAREPGYQATVAQRYILWEQWQRAERAYNYVVLGDTGDDLGNRQIAAYWRAVALFQLGRYDESAELLVPIALDPSHLRFRDALPWLARLVVLVPESVPPLTFVRYRVADLEPMRTAAQRELYERLLFLVGRSRFAQRDYASARAFLDAVPAASPDAPVARECARVARQLTAGP